MLILVRRQSEEIVIGDDIVIRILAINRGYDVRIGITAPRNVSVHRREIQNRIDAEKVKS